MVIGWFGASQVQHQLKRIAAPGATTKFVRRPRTLWPGWPMTHVELRNVGIGTPRAGRLEGVEDLSGENQCKQRAASSP